MREALSKVIADRTEELVQLTVDLVRFPTVNPPGDAYRPCSEFIAKRMTKSGFDCRFFTAEGEPGHTDEYPRVNVVCRHEGKRPGPTVHFNSHIDVVEAGLGWSYPPFEGIVADGKIFGRGTCDMKGGLATSIIAAEAFMAVYPD
ncbi:MAG: M20/M25/M40 family metallo-hydrolase, partial [Pseudomonadota bacterium]